MNNKRGCPTCNGVDPKSCLRCKGKTRMSDWEGAAMNTPTPRYILTCGALIQATDGLGNPAGDWVKYSDYERDLAAREEELTEARTIHEKLREAEYEQSCRAERAEAAAEWQRGIRDQQITKLERDLAAREAELARVKEQADKFKWQVRDTCQRAERAEAERDAAVFAINNHNKDCKASCEEQRSRNSCGFASYYPKKNCPNCPEDWAIDAIGRKP